MSGVDVLAVIANQRARRKSMRIFPAAARKPRKTIKQADVEAAVNNVLDELDAEFRRLCVEFPKFRSAYDTARVVVNNARRKA